MSERTFARRFAAETGTTPRKWLLASGCSVRATCSRPPTSTSRPSPPREGFATAAVLRHHFSTQVGVAPGGVPEDVPHPGRTGRLTRLETKH